MLEQISNTLQFDAFFTASRVGKTGLTPTVDIYRGATQIVTAGSATEIGGGFYTYQLAFGSVTNKNSYRAVFKTTDTTVDQQHIPALWIVGSTWIQNLDAAISGIAAAVWDRLTSLIVVEDSIGDLIIDNLDDVLSSVRTAVAQAVNSISGGADQSDITQTRGDTWSIPLTVTPFVWTAGTDNLRLTIKKKGNFQGIADTAAILQILKTKTDAGSDGLTRLNGSASGLDRTKGSITVVSASVGTITVAVSADITAQLDPGDYVFDIQNVSGSGTAVLTVADGTWAVTGDKTRATA
jgi:hypothetical protein